MYGLMVFLSQLTAQGFENKIDFRVLEKTASGQSTDFLVMMEVQANVHDFRNLNSKEEKGIYVFSSLQQAASHSQKDIIRLLKEKNATYNSLFIVNALHVTGDRDLVNLLAQRADVKKNH